MLNRIAFFRRREELDEVIDAETIGLLGEADEEAAYQTARELMRLARERGDHSVERLYGKVAVRIAEITGRQIGPKAYEDNRSISPKRRIEGGRTLKIR
jgi:hypothetical protein